MRAFPCGLPRGRRFSIRQAPHVLFLVSEIPLDEERRQGDARTRPPARGNCCCFSDPLPGDSRVRSNSRGRSFFQFSLLILQDSRVIPNQIIFSPCLKDEQLRLLGIVRIDQSKKDGLCLMDAILASCDHLKIKLPAQIMVQLPDPDPVTSKRAAALKAALVDALVKDHWEVVSAAIAGLCPGGETSHLNASIAHLPRMGKHIFSASHLSKSPVQTTPRPVWPDS